MTTPSAKKGSRLWLLLLLPLTLLAALMSVRFLQHAAHFDRMHFFGGPLLIAMLSAMVVTFYGIAETALTFIRRSTLLPHFLPALVVLLGTIVAAAFWASSFRPADTAIILKLSLSPTPAPTHP
jgi:hypothetical protein